MHRIMQINARPHLRMGRHDTDKTYRPTMIDPHMITRIRARAHASTIIDIESGGLIESFATPTPGPTIRAAVTLARGL